MTLLTKKETVVLEAQMVILYDDGSLYCQDIKAFLNIKKIEYTEVPAGDTEYSLSVNRTLYNYNAALAWIDKQ